MIILLLLSLTSIQIDRDTATVGDPLIATIKGEIKDSISIIIPDSFPDISLLDTLILSGDTLAMVRFTSFSTGHQEFKILIGGDTLKASYFIRSVLTPENKGLSPIWDPFGFFNWHYLLWGLVIPLCLFAYYLIKRRKREEIYIKEPEMEPGEEALKNLFLLEKRLNDWDWNKIYTSLSYTMRRYIERSKKIPAVETTTSELLRLFKKENLNDLKPIIHRFPHWDLIKFADRESSREEFEGDLATARSIIKEIEEKENDTLQ